MVNMPVIVSIKKYSNPLTVLNYISLLVVGIITLYPVWYVIMYSLSTYSNLIGKGAILIPHGFTLNNIKFVLGSSTIYRAYGNTIFVVAVGTILSLIVTSLFSYAVSRPVAGRKVITLFVYFTMLFGGGMIPTYMVVKQTGLVNSLWSLIIPSLVNPFFIFIMRNFFKSIPESLTESASIDGANDITVFTKIILPLSLPVMATIALFYAVGYWNSFFDAIIYISDSKKWTLQVILRQILINQSPDMLTSSGTSQSVGSGDATAAAVTGEAVRMATVVVSIVPIMLIYPFLQKYFIKGVMLGAVKS